MVRPGALLMATPVFGAAFAPPLVRVGLLLLVTFALAPIVALPADLGRRVDDAGRRAASC